MSQSGPKQYPKRLETFKVGDLVRRKGHDPVYEVVGLNEAFCEALCRSKLSRTEGWIPLYFLEKYSSYEKDDGPLTDEQVAQIKSASSATEIPEHSFTESLLDNPKTQIEQTLQERGSRYGSFNDLAQISQALKDTMRATDGWTRLSASQREALEMVQHKIARMLNGDPTYEDNAVDIVGYSTLMMKNMQGDLKI